MVGLFIVKQEFLLVGLFVVDVRLVHSLIVIVVVKMAQRSNELVKSKSIPQNRAVAPELKILRSTSYLLGLADRTESTSENFVRLDSADSKSHDQAINYE